MVMICSMVGDCPIIVTVVYAVETTWLYDLGSELVSIDMKVLLSSVSPVVVSSSRSWTMFAR